VTDAGIAHIRNLKNLSRLHLERTRITDVGLSSLSGLTELVYLNLYGTTVTDAGLDHLHPLKKLKQLYLSETRTTEEGRLKLQTALPNVRVITNSVQGVHDAQEDRPPLQQ
jgi:Leucine-rich repeat (LRR) protein